MKKYSILVFFVLFTSVSLAQGVRIGLTASPVFGFPNVDKNSSSTYQYSDDTSSKTGFVYGVLTDFDISGDERYYVHSGLTIFHTGVTVEGSQSGIAGPTLFSTEIKQTYIEIPMTLKLKTNTMGYLRYFGQFGLNNDILVSESRENNTGMELDTKNILFAVNMGAGTEYDFSQSTSGLFGIYFNNALSKLIDDNGGSIKNSQLGLRFGIYF